jgi:hypothetical protein
LLPLYEKRQRLLIILENEILSWLDSSTPIRQRNPTLKRIDCRVSAESECKDRCVWKSEDSKCLLHVPTNDGPTPTTKLLIRKLIEELIRFPVKRNELLKQGVGQYVKISAPFRSGNQYIVSEDMPAWSEMLRMDWNNKEESRYLEEYGAIQPLPEAEAASADAEAPVVSPPDEFPPPLIPAITPEEAEAEAPEAPEVPEVPEESAPEVSEVPDNSLEGLDVEEDLEVPERSQEIQSIPSADISNIKAKFGSKYFFIVETSITEALNSFISNEEFEAVGQDLNSSIDLEVAKYIVSSTGLTFYQLIYPPGNPIPSKPLIVRFGANGQKSDVIVIIQLPDGRIGVLSSSPTEIIAISYDTLPMIVKSEITRSPSVNNE